MARPILQILSRSSTRRRRCYSTCRLKNGPLCLITKTAQRREDARLASTVLTPGSKHQFQLIFLSVCSILLENDGLRLVLMKKKRTSNGALLSLGMFNCLVWHDARTSIRAASWYVQADDSGPTGWFLPYARRNDQLCNFQARR